MSDMREALAAAMQQQQPAPQQQQPTGNKGGLGELAQVYAKCEQTGQCSPEDAQVLQQGLPQLQKMAQNIEQILQSVGGQQQAPGAPAGA